MSNCWHNSYTELTPNCFVNANDTGYQQVCNDTGYQQVCNDTGYLHVCNDTIYLHMCNDTGYLHVCNDTGNLHVCNDNDNIAYHWNDTDYTVCKHNIICVLMTLERSVLDSLKVCDERLVYCWLLWTRITPTPDRCDNYHFWICIWIWTFYIITRISLWFLK